jgi:hypothetical protein
VKNQPPFGMNGEGIVGREAAAERRCFPPSFNAAGDGVNVFIAQTFIIEHRKIGATRRQRERSAAFTPLQRANSRRDGKFYAPRGWPR